MHAGMSFQMQKAAAGVGQGATPTGLLPSARCGHTQAYGIDASACMRLPVVEIMDS